MLVRHLMSTFCDVLGFYGKPCIEIGLGGASNIALPDLIGRVTKAIVSLGMKQPIIVVDFEGAQVFDEPELEECIYVMKSRGYLVIGKAIGTAYPKQLASCTYKVAVIAGTNWLGYGVDEIQYEPTVESGTAAVNNLFVPVIPKIMGVKINEWPAAKQFEFMKNSKFVWSVHPGSVFPTMMI